MTNQQKLEKLQATLATLRQVSENGFEQHSRKVGINASLDLWKEAVGLDMAEEKAHKAKLQSVLSAISFLESQINLEYALSL